MENLPTTKETFKATFGEKFPQMIEERLMTKAEAYKLCASLFPPAIGKEIMEDYSSLLPEYKRGYVSSIMEIYTNGFAHYGFREMVAFAKS